MSSFDGFISGGAPSASCKALAPIILAISNLVKGFIITPQKAGIIRKSGEKELKSYIFVIGAIFWAL